MPTPNVRDTNAIKGTHKRLGIALQCLVSRATAGSSAASYDHMDNEQVVNEVHRLCAALVAQVDEHAPWPDNRGGNARR